MLCVFCEVGLELFYITDVTLRFSGLETLAASGEWGLCDSETLRTSVAYPGIFFRGGGFNKFSSGQRERGSGGGSPLVRGSGGSCNLVQEISFHIVKFS